MNNKTIKIGVFLAFILISIYVGTKLYNLDAKEAVEYFVPYIIFVFCYLIAAVAYLIYRLSKGKNIKFLAIQIVISVLPLIIIPYGFNWKKLQENQLAVEEIEQMEHEKYLVDLERINLTIKEYPDSSILYIKRAQLKRSQGLWEESLADCQISLNKEENTEAYWELGWCHEHLGHLDKALMSYQKAAILDSSLIWPKKRIEVVKRKINKSL